MGNVIQVPIQADTQISDAEAAALRAAEIARKAKQAAAAPANQSSKSKEAAQPERDCVYIGPTQDSITSAVTGPDDSLYQCTFVSEQSKKDQPTTESTNNPQTAQLSKAAQRISGGVNAQRPEKTVCTYQSIENSIVGSVMEDPAGHTVGIYLNCQSVTSK